MPAEGTEEKQCRICLDGPDPSLGKLIRPCLCRGTISHVHVQCLNKWRQMSSSRSAFFECPQCHYRYAFARTRALGLAESPIFVGVLSTLLFVALVICSSFVATFFMNDNPSYSSSWTSWIITPADVAGDLLRVALRILQDEDLIDVDKLWSKSSPRRATARHPPLAPSPPQSLFGSLLRRFILGLPVVSVASLFRLISAGLVGPIHWLTQMRGRRRRNRDGDRDIAGLFILLLIAAGAARALWQVYQFTQNIAKRALLRTEEAILEVG